MDANDRILIALGEALPVLLALAVAGAAAFAYFALLGFLHVKARRTFLFYKELSRQIQEAEALQKGGTEVSYLPRYQELHALLRALLEREGILRKSEIRKPKA